MTTAKDYRQYAGECVEAARLASRDDVRANLLAMAERFNKLAESAERNAHLRREDAE